MRQASTYFKALGDDTRLRILRELNAREMYAELLAERLQLAPATVSFHMKKLLAAGLVAARREQYYTIYTLKKEAMRMTVADMALSGEETDAQQRLREEQYRARVLKTFMPNGYCAAMPAQFKKRQIVLAEIFRAFEAGKTYPEREVNRIIERYYDDYCMVRRAFISSGWMTRAAGMYTVADTAGA